MQIGTLGEYPLDFYVNSGSRMWIDTNGNVGIGVTSPTHILHINGQGRSTESTWATSSDIRVKQNISDLTGSLDKLCQLRPISFEFIDEYKKFKNGLDGQKMGFVAQEVKELLPEMVTIIPEEYGGKEIEGIDEDGKVTVKRINTKSIDDFHLLNLSNMLPMLVQAVQELKSKNDELTQEINNLKLIIKSLRNK